jgi:hypothetical protein
MDPEHGELHILEHFLGFREVVNRSAVGGEFDRKGGDHPRERAVQGCFQPLARLAAAWSASSVRPELVVGRWVETAPLRAIAFRPGPAERLRRLCHNGAGISYDHLEDLVAAVTRLQGAPSPLELVQAAGCGQRRLIHE